MTKEKCIGKVTHYFGNISVGVIQLEDELKLGDEIHIKGATTDFTQKVESMQIDRKPIEIARKGDSIGLKVIDRVREGDKIFKIE